MNQDFKIPPLACDCHIHVFGDPGRYPPSPRRLYTPTAAPLDEYRKVAAAMGLERAVLVQASAYGADNSLILDELRNHPTTARGVAVIDESTPEERLDEMQRAGVVGVRVGLVNIDITPDGARQRLRDTCERVAPRGWHVQVLARAAFLEAIVPIVHELPAPIVFDHMGWPDASLGPNQSGLRELRGLLEQGHCWVKVSGSTHVSRLESGFRDALPIMRSLIVANPARIVWGTDWPHIKQQGLSSSRQPQPVTFIPIANADLLRLLGEATQDQTTLDRILVENPARLYDFPM
jgi:predicted TIM-barrel fold metal-dependent hydrolase